MAQLYVLFDPCTRVIAAVYGEQRMRVLMAVPNMTVDALRLPVGVSARPGQDIDSIPFRDGRRTVS